MEQVVNLALFQHKGHEEQKKVIETEVIETLEVEVQCEEIQLKEESMQTIFEVIEKQEYQFLENDFSSCLPTSIIRSIPQLLS